MVVPPPNFHPEPVHVKKDLGFGLFVDYVIKCDFFLFKLIFENHSCPIPIHFDDIINPPWNGCDSEVSESTGEVEL